MVSADRYVNNDGDMATKIVEVYVFSSHALIRVFLI